MYNKPLKSIKKCEYPKIEMGKGLEKAFTEAETQMTSMQNDMLNFISNQKI